MRSSLPRRRPEPRAAQGRCASPFGASPDAAAVEGTGVVRASTAATWSESATAPAAETEYRATTKSFGLRSAGVVGEVPLRSFVAGVILRVTVRRSVCPFWGGELTDSRTVTRFAFRSTETISPTMAWAVPAGAGDGTGVG